MRSRDEYRSRRIVGIAVVLLSLTSLPGWATQSRHALVIANGNYHDNVGVLRKTYDDAETITTALSAVDFSVVRVTDAGKQTMLNAISEFVARLQDADSIGFFYFAGHGAAQEKRGENYLLPVDAEVRSSADLPLWAISMSSVMESIEATQAGANFIVIDACRNVAFTRGANRGGLVPVKKYNDMIIAFSTKPGDVAADNGMYALSLARAIRQPGLRAEAVFNVVQEEISRASDREQVPWAEDGLIDAFYFTESTDAETLRAPRVVATLPADPPPNPGFVIVPGSFRGLVTSSTGMFEKPDKLSRRHRRLQVGETVKVTGRVRDRLYYQVELDGGSEAYVSTDAIERL